MSDKEKLDKELLDVFRNKLQKLGYYIHIGEGKRNTYNYSIDIQHKDRYEYTSESIWGLGTFEYFYLTKSNLDVLLDFIRIITSK